MTLKWVNLGQEYIKVQRNNKKIKKRMINFKNVFINDQVALACKNGENKFTEQPTYLLGTYRCYQNVTECHARTS